jgi:hypothetical protein
MTKRLTICLAALLLLGLPLASCGSDDKDKAGDSGSSSSSTEKKGASPEADKGSKPEKGNDSNLSNPQVKQAIASCKQSVNGAQVSAGVKKDLAKICEQAASGDEDAVRKASKDVCKKIVESSVPAGPSRETAVKACDQSTAAP